MDHAKIGACNLNQWALDFEGNQRRIIESIKIAKQQNCTYRVGPELEVTGYTCQDHFLELDTIKHSWEVLAYILSTDLTNNIICDIGMPVLHRGNLYNTRVIILNKYIHLIRPKLVMADDGNYREARYFSPWRKKDLETFVLPSSIRKVTGQEETPIGNAIMSLTDSELAIEICEELWQPNSPHIDMALSGAEIIFNSSASHFAVGRIQKRYDLIKETTSKDGVCYVYSNLVGCDGDRLYFDGCSLISINGIFLARGKQFTLNEVEVVTAVIDLDQLRSRRVEAKTRSSEAMNVPYFPRIYINFRLCQSKEEATAPLETTSFALEKHAEIGYGPACYLWDLLRKSGACGYFLPFSGGADSTATALIVYNMAYLVLETLEEKSQGHEFISGELRKIVRDDKFMPKSPQDIVKKVLYTCYMKSKHSSDKTRKRAENIANEIGCVHSEVEIDGMCEGFMKSGDAFLTQRPRFESEGGDMREDLALQNLQARTRMVLSYYLSQSFPIQYKLPSFLLVLASANLDESLRGYVTKYDCSSADINPIGGFSKVDLRKFLYWCHDVRKIKSVAEILEAAPTAELRPTTSGGKAQEDEEEMGLTYIELSLLGRLRKLDLMGPVAMFKKVIQIWENRSLEAVADKVKKFFKYYAINRHKMTTLTPSIHAEKYGCEDNRYDLRPFLYNTKWTHQFHQIDSLLNSEQDEILIGRPKNPKGIEEDLQKSTA